MDSKPLTIEQQRAYVQAWKTYGPLQERIKAEEARGMTQEEKWAAVETVQRFAEQAAGPNRRIEVKPEEHGLVIQQRYFMKLHRRA